MSNLMKKWNSLSLVKRIFVGLIIGIALALTVPEQVSGITIFGALFVGALKAIAPILVFFLVMSAISGHREGTETNMKSIIVLYLLGTFLAGLIAVIASFLFPVSLTLGAGVDSITPPGGVVEVLKALLMNVVDNPVKALFNANYIGILAWAVVFGLALKAATPGTKKALHDISAAVTKAVHWIINCAPFGILGLVYNTVSTNGLSIFTDYGKLLALLVGCMLFTVFVTNPIIVFSMLRRNPYPLILKCLKESGLTTFNTSELL